MNKLLLFIDGSVDPSSKTGFGAYLIVNETLLFDKTKKQNVKIKKFTNTSSTKLELETLLWALNDIDINLQKCEIIIHTDSQNIMGLMNRRIRLEQNNYCSKHGKLIKNYELYKDFFSIIDQLSCTFIKLKGHKSKMLKDEIDKFFSLVDKASRNALRMGLI